MHESKRKNIARTAKEKCFGDKGKGLSRQDGNAKRGLQIARRGGLDGMKCKQNIA